MKYFLVIFFLTKLCTILYQNKISESNFCWVNYKKPSSWKTLAAPPLYPSPELPLLLFPLSLTVASTHPSLHNHYFLFRDCTVHEIVVGGGPSSLFRAKPPPPLPPFFFFFFFFLCRSSSPPSAVSRSHFAGYFVSFYMWSSSVFQFSIFVARRRSGVAHFSSSLPFSWRQDLCLPVNGEISNGR